jgi:hypothetical protein
MRAPSLRALFLVGVWLAASLALAGTVQAAQRTFASPEAAVEALVTALSANDQPGLAAILGDPRLTPGAQKEDSDDVAAFLKEYAAKHDLAKPGADLAVLTVGGDGWTFPVPIRQRDKAWAFDTRAGMREIFNRNIGRNELLTMETLMAYVQAQQEFAARRGQAGTQGQFACRIFSQPGKKNGLYWQAPPAGPTSPMGPLAAMAAENECQALGLKPVAFNGYYFKLLTRQGKNAPGGAHSYLARGRMVLGYACLAYPQRYGVSGVVSFLVNQDGVIHQKDLGQKTGRTARAMAAYDPDKTWVKAEMAEAQPATPAPGPQNTAPAPAEPAPAGP